MVQFRVFFFSFFLMSPHFICRTRLEGVFLTPLKSEWNVFLIIIRKGGEVPEIEWCGPGENAAMEVLMGSKNGFLTKRLNNYSTDRNNPLKPKALSGLSLYLHFGQISAQRCAFEARKFRKLSPQVCAFFAIKFCCFLRFLKFPLFV